MKDFNLTQKLLMAVAIIAAVAFATLMAIPADTTTARTASTSQAAGLMHPF